MSVHDIIQRQRQQRMQEQLDATNIRVDHAASVYTRNTASFRSMAIEAEEDGLTVSGTLPSRADASLKGIGNMGQVLPGQSGLMLTPEGDYNRGSSVLFISPWLSTDEDI